MKKTTQREKLVRYLNIHKTITPLVARHVLGIERLAARIYDLKRTGMKITSKQMKDFEGRRFSIYQLEG